MRAALARRDDTLAAEQGEIVLWFETDLYDQLQLIQVLERLEDEATVTLVTTASFASLTPKRAHRLWGEGSTIGPAERTLAAAAWHAFRSPDPTAIETLLAAGTAALPELGRALRRHLEQFPGVGTGLGRSEMQVLGVVSKRVRSLHTIFNAQQALEERPFMGDAWVWRIVERFGRAPALLEGPDGAISRTELGREIFSGGADYVALGGGGRWLGGVELRDGSAAWRWDGEAQALLRA